MPERAPMRIVLDFGNPSVESHLFQMPVLLFAHRLRELQRIVIRVPIAICVSRRIEEVLSVDERDDPRSLAIASQVVTQ